MTIEEQRPISSYPVHFDTDYDSGTTVVWRGPWHNGNYVSFDWYAFRRFADAKGIQLKAKDGDKTLWQGWEIWASYYGQQKHHTVFKRWVGKKEDGPPQIKLYVEADWLVTQLDFISMEWQKLRDKLQTRMFRI